MYGLIEVYCAGCSKLVAVTEAQAAEPVYCSDECELDLCARQLKPCPGCGCDIPAFDRACTPCLKGAR